LAVIASERPVLRWGLLGTARINRLIIPAIRASRRSCVTTVASRDAARGTAYAAEWEIARVRTYEGLLADPDVDVVYVPLPNSLHAPWTVRACEAGKHVLCEKPLAITTPEIDAIAAAARRHGRVVAEGFMYRHHAQTARMLELVVGGAIGALRTMVSAFTFTLTRNPDVRLDPALGGGSLWDVGCYPVSLAQLVTGAEPVEVSAIQQVGASGVDEYFAAAMRYASGVTAQFHCGFRSAYQSFARFVGTEGVLHVERPFRPEGQPMVLSRGGASEEVSVEGAAIFVDEIADMEDAVLGLKPPRISLAESRMHVATIEALYRAAREGGAARV
jgi:D-xylose 1-dehydrogenase (NADP+, D-xylono-1,5-lactone-forming)